MLYYWNGAWGSYSAANGSFSVLVSDDQAGDTAYAAGPNGLTYIYYTNRAYQTAQINNTIYTAVTPIGGDTLGVFGALASGGIEKIYFDGTNVVTETVLGSGYFSRLCNDWTSPSLLMGIQIPEPATLILLTLGGLLLRKRS